MNMAQLDQRQVLGKAQSILLDDSHPMHHEFHLLPYGFHSFFVCVCEDLRLFYMLVLFVFDCFMLVCCNPIALGKLKKMN